ncbi:MAG: F420-nonreducing hydrogenase [Fervidicoccaceae archaeon]
MNKLKVAWYWCASCGGCEESFVDLSEELVEFFESADLVFCPVATDFKKEDVERLPDASVDVALINGGIRLSEHEEMVKLLRRKSKIVVAYGTCSSWGGIPGLSNLYNKEEILRAKYLDPPSINNPTHAIPAERTRLTKLGANLELPAFLDSLLPLNAVIDVDYYIPGCPPTPEVFKNALKALISEKLPPKGSIIGASDKSLCDECPLNSTKPEKILLKELKRPHETIADAKKCLLTQGLLCLGPVTRGGCGALCIKAAMQCTGCFGPLDGIADYGGKAISFIGTIMDYSPAEEEELERAYSKIKDWVGVVYKYTLPASKLGGRVRREKTKRQEEAEIDE